MHTGKLLLIVDDNLNFVKRLISILEDVPNIRGINIASDFDEAISLFAADEYDVVLLDINLPGKNGIELLKIFKKQRPGCDIIMITNHADSYYRQLCLNLGAKHFLDKSNDYGTISTLVA
jgi:DNA-binding NarL/FixJ family response regulator